MELGGAGEGTVRDNRKTLLLTTKCLPDQRLFPLVPSHSYTCAHTNTHAHIHTHGDAHTCTHKYSYMLTHMQHMNVISWAHDYKWHVLVHTRTYSYRCSHMHSHTLRCTCSHTCAQMHIHRWVCTFTQLHPFFKMANYCCLKKIHPTVVSQGSSSTQTQASSAHLPWTPPLLEAQ